MRTTEIAPLRVFLKVVEHRSFVRAAADLGLSPPATSQSIRALEARLGAQLLRRTTRSVTPTPEGERLAQRIQPLLDALDATLDEASGARRTTRGSVRISVPRFAAERWVARWLTPFGQAHPDVLVEVSVDDALVGLAEGGYDAGIRLGERLAPGMIAIPIGGSLRMAALASPAYLAKHGTPKSPRELVDHRCIGHRLATRGELYRWEFERGGKTFSVSAGAGSAGADARGGLIVNDARLALDVAADGGGIAFAFADQASAYVRERRLVPILEPWCPPFAGLYLYYARHANMAPALRAFLDFVRSDVSAKGRTRRSR